MNTKLRAMTARYKDLTVAINWSVLAKSAIGLGSPPSTS